MQRARSTHRLTASAWVSLTLGLTAAGAASVADAAPTVEFDFARIAECRDVTPAEFAGPYPKQRLVELTLPVSVRFRGASPADVEEVMIEINGAASGLRVQDFSPKTQLATDVAQPIETITTTKRARSLDATLGGELPLPFAEVVAHVSPSINAGVSGSETETEKLNRLPPKHAVVVSGTSFEGRGVFFKLKRSTQTSLEGVHVLSVTFVVTPAWRGGEVHVACNARGRKKLLWIDQEAILGRELDAVRLHFVGRREVHAVAKPVIADVAPDEKSKPVGTQVLKTSLTEGSTADDGAVESNSP